jgi:hypothetical protein
MRQHLKNFHGMTTSNNGSVTHWLKRQDFVFTNSSNLRQIYHEWMDVDEDVKVDDLCVMINAMIPATTTPIGSNLSQRLRKEFRDVLKQTSEDIGGALHPWQITHALNLNCAQYAWAIENR